MIYVDTSVALAQLLAEDRCPPPEFWENALISSRLIEYELWSAIHRQGLTRSHEESVRRIIESLAIVEMNRESLARAIEPFPTRVRTLHALHLATITRLIQEGIRIELATYDRRMIAAAEALRIDLAPC